ncbi:MAG: undecaprenyldiphospho-muramoylpentapeptide beta-N-acetylglucosaminyltransferase [Treponema sp.]|jgi:UDP-N-acetylglucosamine--N-acetylmuramyl-(pentapeptide) pyrophosphoryl-undecaprenol N-acetylglucosamine transferase|nr:undecaprenyldiphospho-muramoylpentapeptide beta-N-acetylglucosaminyltransferase [Treponema sp.]
MQTIVFTGGGTGGHIYPGLAVASHLQKAGAIRVVWLGANTGMDSAIVEKAGVEFFGIPSGKLRRYVSAKNIADAFRVGAGFFAAQAILRKLKPALLFSKGGFVSVPPCAAAYSLGIPVFTHESDFSPGLATKINTRFAQKIFIAYHETASFFPPKARERLIVSGNPVRAAFRDADSAAGRAFLGLGNDERILLALGASQGARQINELVRDTLDELTKRYTVVHQVGPATDWTLAKTETYRPYPFFHDEMPHVLAAAELVLCRSGAGTVWECATAGHPMILIPLSGSATRGDQVENARVFERAGAALSLADLAATPDALVHAVADIADNDEKRRSMAAASTRLGQGDAARLIAKTILEAL